jgi:Phosphate-selective porin O and P
MAVMAWCAPALAPAADSPLPVSDTTQAAALDAGIEDRLIQLDNQLDDDAGELRSLEGALQDVHGVREGHSGEARPTGDLKAGGAGTMPFDGVAAYNDAAMETPLVWHRFSLLVNVDVEYTSEYDSKPQHNSVLGSGNTPGFIVPDAPGTPSQPVPNGAEGAFFKHVDFHFKYKFGQGMFLKLDYNFAALELDDAGVGWDGLPLLPAAWGDYSYSVFVGQKRQSFGIEQQTDSRYLMFPDRAMMYGGHNPFDQPPTPAADPFDFFDQALTIGNGLSTANEDDDEDHIIPELAFEKVMGVHFFHAHDFGFLGYTLGGDIVNDESEESQDGQITDSLQLGFPMQTQDQDVSEIGRLGLEPRLLNDVLPFGSKFNFGFSAFHDPENTAYHASQPKDEEWADAQGADGTLQTDRQVLYLQAEYVRRDQYGPSFNTLTLLPNNAYGGLQGRAESYYVSESFQPWRLFDPEAPRVELLARYENFYFDELKPWLREALGPYTGSFNAITVGIKYTYAGNCHTSLNYTTYGLNNEFYAVGPTEYLHLEQQVNF